MCMKVDRLIYHKMCEDLRLFFREGVHSLGTSESLLKQSGNLKNAENNFGTKYKDVVNISLENQSSSSWMDLRSISGFRHVLLGSFGVSRRVGDLET